MSRHQLLQLGKEGCKGIGFGLLQKIWNVQQPPQLVFPVAWAYLQFSRTDSVETEVLPSLCLDRLYSNQLCLNSIATEKLSTKGKSSKVYRNPDKHLKTTVAHSEFKAGRGLVPKRRQHR